MHYLGRQIEIGATKMAHLAVSAGHTAAGV